MNQNTINEVAGLLERLHREADASDRDHRQAMQAKIQTPGLSIDALIADILAGEEDYRTAYSNFANNFLAVSPEYGLFLYAIARARGAKLIVEFGTSMGLSTIYLAAALRDNGGGHLISSELEASKVARARENLEEAGLADLVEIRAGDALETLRDVRGDVDMLLVDGAFSLYLPVLKLIEPSLRPGAVILGENAFAPEYLEYIRRPEGGFVSFGLPDPSRGNQFTVKLG